MKVAPWRRSRLLAVAAVAVSIVLTITSSPRPVSADTDLVIGGNATVSYANGDSVYVRASGSYGGSILTSLSEGSTISVLDGPFSDGAGSSWYYISDGGVTGYMVSDYLANGSVPSINSNSSIVDYAYVIDGALNLRAAPGTGAAVLTVLPDGAEVGVTGSAQNGFYPVRYGGVDGFAYAEFLSFGSSGTTSSGASIIDYAMVIDGALNLRSGASTGTSVLLVLPDGAEVGITGSAENGFYPVRYSGVDGFAYAEFLSFGSEPQTTSASVIDTAFTTTSLNLRSGASTGSAVVAVMPGGAEVGITGSQSGGWYPVRFDGVDGFAYGDYLSSSAPSNESASPTTSTSGGSGIVWPVVGGAWEITQGYNGSSHVNRSSSWQYNHAFDIARVDRNTSGQSVYAPASGTVRWTERGSGGIVIDMGNGYAVALFHLTVDRGWVAGDQIGQGDYIGYVSYPGGEGFAQFAHIHLSVWSSTDGGNWSRVSVPFSGQNAISGVSYPETGGYSQWLGTVFYP